MRSRQSTLLTVHSFFRFPIIVQELCLNNPKTPISEGFSLDLPRDVGKYPGRVNIRSTSVGSFPTSAIPS